MNSHAVERTLERTKEHSKKRSKRRSKGRSIFAATFRRPIATIMFFSGICVLGVVAALRMPTTLLPGSRQSGLTLETEFTGADPTKVEEVITRPLEEALSSVGGIERIYSVSEEGKSRIYLEFESGSELENKSLEIREQIDPIASRFRREIRKPVLLRYDPDRKPVLIIAIEGGKRSIEELREIADREAKKALEGVPGISEVGVSGGRIREVLISCDRRNLETAGVSLASIMAALQSSNLNAAAGRIEHHGGTIPVYLRGRFKSVSEIARLIIRRGEKGGLLRLADAARVSFAYRDKSDSSRINGVERVTLYVQKAGDANLIQFSESALSTLRALERDDLKFHVIYNQAETLVSALRNLAIAGAAGLASTLIFFILVSGSVHRAIVLLPAFPFSLCAATLLLFLSGSGFDLLSLSGLLLGSGLSLALLAMILIASGQEDQKFPSSRRCKMLGLCLLAPVLIGAVFSPLLFSGPEMLNLYGGLVLALLSCLFASAAYAVLLMPLLERHLAYASNAILLPHILQSTRFRTIVHTTHFFNNTLPTFIMRMGERIERNRRFAIIIVFIFLCGGVFLFATAPRTILVPVEENRIEARAEFPSGTSFAATDAMARKIEAKMRMLRGVQEISSRAEAGQATFYLKLEPGLRADEKRLQNYTSRMGRFDPVYLHFSPVGSFAGLREITVDVLGEEIVVLDRIVRRMAKKARAIPGVSSVVLRYKPPRPELRIRIDRIKAQLSGLSTASIGQALRLGIEGGVASKFLQRNRELDIRIRFAEQYRRKLQDIRTFSIRNVRGLFVPVAEMASLEKGMGALKVYRKNKKRSLSFSIRAKAGHLEAVRAAMVPILNQPLPERYRAEFGGSHRKIQEARSRLNHMLPLALLLLYMLLAAYFESLRRPLLLLLPLPVPLLGSLYTLRLFGIALSVPVFVGFIIIAGLTAITTLIILDLFRTGDDAASQISIPGMACGILTAFYLPLLFIFGPGGEFLRGIALTVISGTITLWLFLPLLTKNSLRLYERYQSIRMRHLFTSFILMMPLMMLIMMPIAASFPGEGRLHAAGTHATDRRIVLDLDRAVRIGITNHFALKAIRNRKMAVRELITERWREYLPQVGISYNRVREINVGEPDNISHEIRLNIEQVLYDGGRRGLNLDLARIDALLAREDFRITYNRLRLDIQQTYLRALSSRGKIVLNRKSLMRAQEQLRLARRELALGFSTRLQVLQTAARVREIEFSVQKAVTLFNQNLHDIKLALNLHIDAQIELRGRLYQDFMLRPPAADVRRLSHMAMRNRPEIYRSRADLRRRKKELEIAENAWIPRVSVGGFAGRRGESFPIRQRSFGVNFKLTFPLGSSTGDASSVAGNRRNGTGVGGSSTTGIRFYDDLGYNRRVMEAKNALGESISEYGLLRNRLGIEVRKTYDRLRETWETIRIGNGRVYFQHESLRIMRVRYRTGGAKRSDIVFAETELVRAQEDLMDAVAVYLTAAYELENAAGLRPGSLKFFDYRNGSGNTLLRYLASGDRLPNGNSSSRKKIKRTNQIIRDTMEHKRKNRNGKKNRKERFLLDDIKLE